MNTKRYFFVLFVILAQVLAACGSPAPATESPTEPTLVPTSVPEPVGPDPIAVVQDFYAALKVNDVDAAMALVAEEARWRGTPTLTGKDRIREYLQGGIDAGFTTEISDLRATKGRVTFTSEAYKNSLAQASGEETYTVENGLITSFESYAVLGSDIRPNIPEVAFTATDSAYTGPDVIKGGWVQVTLTNDGQEGHHIQLVKLLDGKTLDDLKAALTADGENYPAWAMPYGGPNAPDPGGSVSAILFLQAGNYAMVDIIPDAEGKPHFQNGLIKFLSVTEPSGILPGEPKPDVSIELNDFNFKASGSFSAGEQTIRFLNAGQQVHEAYLVKLEQGKTAPDYLNAAPGTPPPGAAVGGITGIASGDSQYIEVTLEPGTYALFCFLPDPTSHAPHFVVGMVQEFSIALDPAAVVQGFWEAMKAGDVDAALTYIAEDAKCKGSCYFSGKPSFRAYLQGYINSGTVTELGELTVEGDTVRYPFKEYRDGFLKNDNSTPESMQIKDGKITFWENLHL
jgi:ketosteroid isomerase-like protein